MSESVTLIHMSDDNVPRQWCVSCRAAVTPSVDAEDQCPECGGELKSLRQLTRVERSMHEFQEWMWKVQDEDKWGPSPGGAAGELRCSRSMIDKLVSVGVLERSEYNKDGHHVVMISARSIKQAQENKAKYGQWKPRDDWHDLPAGKPGRGR